MQMLWQTKPQPELEVVDFLTEKLNIDSYLAKILARREVHSYEQAKAFFRPSLASLSDPLAMLGMEVAVERLLRALQNQEKILIMGDYDVDGTTATALVYNCLKNHTDALGYYIPNRINEGYGVSESSVEQAITQGVNLIISLDCGIKAIDPVQKARDAGIDFIICDHHQPGEDLPSALAILNPQQASCPYPYKDLSGCGIAFRFMQALAQQEGWEEDHILRQLDLVALSIAADIVPMDGENRILAFYGLRLMNSEPNPGIQALAAEAGLSPQVPMDVNDLVFKLAPRLNAAGRLSDARLVVQLFTERSPDSLRSLAREMSELNQKRRQLDREYTQEALGMIEEVYGDKAQEVYTTVLYNERWHPGLLGIIAARCIRHYYRPTVILTQGSEPGQLVGSARSIKEFDLIRAIESCHHLLDRFGGHHQAAGITLAHGNLEAFKNAMEEYTESIGLTEPQKAELEIEDELPLDRLDPTFFRILRQFAPFGPNNRRPVFLSRDIKARQVRRIRDRHLRFEVSGPGEKPLPVIGFGMAEHYERIKNAGTLDLCYVLEEDWYKSGKNPSFQLRIKDFSIK